MIAQLQQMNAKVPPLLFMLFMVTKLLILQFKLLFL